MIIENPRGGYDFIRGIGPFSAAVRARAGHAIVRATFKPAAALNRGYALLEQHFEAAQRPLAALCGMQLRIAEPLSREGFEQFNRPYIEKLRGWGLEIEHANPVTRTNVALSGGSIAEPSLAGFFYTIPSMHDRPSWVVSGVPEMAMRNGAVHIVAPGDTSSAAMQQKLQSVLDTIAAHLAELRLNWANATTINLYTVHDLHPLLTSMLFPKIAASQSGITLYHARPPVTGLELEIDAWSILREEIIEP